MKKLPLSQNKIALVSDLDFERANRFKWYAHKHPKRNVWYARRSVKVSGKTKTVLLHHFILGHARTDHRNGDGLDNRRSNLRTATSSQNGMGFKREKVGFASKYRGVRWHERNRCWQAQIKKTGKFFYLGSFGDQMSAAKAYDSAARKMFGRFATPNFK